MTAEETKALEAKEKKEVSEDDFRMLVEAGVYAKAAGEINAFIGVLSQGAGPAAAEYQATVQEALFIANGNKITAWLKPRANNLCDRLIQLVTPAEVAEEMYLSILTRLPTQDEIELVTQHLAGRDKDRNAAIEEMAWGLMASAEFRFNH